MGPTASTVRASNPTDELKRDITNGILWMKILLFLIICSSDNSFAKKGFLPLIVRRVLKWFLLSESTWWQQSIKTFNGNAKWFPSEELAKIFCKCILYSKRWRMTKERKYIQHLPRKSSKASKIFAVEKDDCGIPENKRWRGEEEWN